MELIVLSIHLLVCICLIGLVLLQRSEGGALGMGGGGSGSLMSGRGAADALAKMTSVAGGFFLVTSLSLTFLSGAAASNSGRSVLDTAPVERPATTPAAPAPAEPARPDPTESSLPSETQLAAFGPAEAAAATPDVAPAPSAAATRAGPIERTTATQPPAQRSASTPRQQPAAARTQPTSSQPAAAQPTSPSTTTIRSTGATTPATIPGQTRTGAVDGVNLTEPAQPEAESVDLGNGLEAVRRERAGPDQ